MIQFQFLDKICIAWLQNPKLWPWLHQAAPLSEPCRLISNQYHIFLDSCLVRMWFRMFIPEDDRVRTLMLAQLIQRKSHFSFARLGRSTNLWSNRHCFWSLLVFLDKFKSQKPGNSNKKKRRKFEKKVGVPLAFFYFFAGNFSSEFSRNYDISLLRDTKGDWKRCQFLHKMIKRPDNTKWNLRFPPNKLCKLSGRNFKIFQDEHFKNNIRTKRNNMIQD